MIVQLRRAYVCEPEKDADFCNAIRRLGICHVARKARVTPQTISRFIVGERRLSELIYCRVCEIVGYEPPNLPIEARIEGSAAGPDDSVPGDSEDGASEHGRASGAGDG